MKETALAQCSMCQCVQNAEAQKMSVRVVSPLQDIGKTNVVTVNQEDKSHGVSTTIMDEADEGIIK